MRFTKAATKREAIVGAIAEFNRRRRMAELNKYSNFYDTLMSFEQLMENRETDLPKSTQLYS